MLSNIYDIIDIMYCLHFMSSNKYITVKSKEKRVYTIPLFKKYCPKQDYQMS